MNKFITLSYYKSYGDHDGNMHCWGDGDNCKPFTIVLNLNAIQEIVNTPRLTRVYNDYEKAKANIGAYTSQDLYYVGTNIAYGCGINGVDYKCYCITGKSYRKLMAVLDPISCD